LTNNRVNTSYDFFAKSNEIHLASGSRPRAIFNPSDELKAVGAYVSRFFIRIMKEIEPGFVSGYTEN
jgi:hypothetical protein